MLTFKLLGHGHQFYYIEFHFAIFIYFVFPNDLPAVASIERNARILWASLIFFAFEEIIRDN